MQARLQELARIQANDEYRGDYYRISLIAPQISSHCMPGQFVDLKLPNSPHLLLRRPFSIFDADSESGVLTLLYKTVGQGTRLMAELPVGCDVDLLGPLGNGFPAPEPNRQVVIVAGGYGCAATYLIAKRHNNPGRCLIGGRRAVDVLLQNEFEAVGYRVDVSTDDGSLGHRGVVTDLLSKVLSESSGESPIVYACGPNAMLRAVAKASEPFDVDPFVSLDQNMCCGVGACFSCVVKLRADTPEGWEYVRSCRQGPVFRGSQIYWE